MGRQDAPGAFSTGSDCSAKHRDIGPYGGGGNASIEPTLITGQERAS